ncbi:hypothetical protein PG991_001406 [Apiospora marii]|uniref:Uncharacterized protein n=1 Tax=Apiospora marii TaxID=335849 RepID=A0ABR1SS06_9PEZI
MDFTISDGSPWHELSSQQRKAIDELLRAQFIYCDDWAKYSYPEFHAFIVIGVFFNWTAKTKPNVPSVTYPQIEEFSFTRRSAKVSQPANPPGQEVERPSKIRRTSGTDAASQQSSNSDRAQSNSQPFHLTLASPSSKPGSYSKQIEMVVTSRETVIEAINKADYSLYRDYSTQNRWIVIFLIRKYLYNASRVDPWFPEQDGKPGLSSSDIRPIPSGSVYIEEAIEVMKAAVENLEAAKRDP